MAGYIGSKASVVSSGAERKKTFTITGATTSLTGLNYTVGKVHVFQNGVRLVDGTDYTATNGTTITLTVAAQSGDNVVVISQASYQVALSGIDDQSNATALTIDSSENVFVGMASSSGTADGLRVIPDHFMSFTNNRTNAADRLVLLNREASDGTHIEFRKANASVGSIGVDNSTRLYFTNNTGAGLFLSDGSQVEPMSNGTRTDDTMSLGGSVYRFKDAYLSGGVYLGGTGSANKLEDYEEGTWTPSMSGMGDATFSQQFGRYTKIGDLVHVTGKIAWTGANGSSQVSITGLPFTATNASDAQLRNSAWPQGDYRNIPNLITRNGHFRVSGATLFGVIDNNSGYTSGMTRSELDTFGEFNFYTVYKST